MREDDANVGIAPRRTAEDQLCDRASRVGSVLNFRIRDIRENVPTAVGGFRVRVDDGPAPVELLKNGIEKWITEPFVSVVGIHGHAIGLEGVQTVLNFAQTAFDIRQGQVNEHTETAFVIGNQVCCLIVAAAGQTPGHIGVAGPYAGRRERRNGSRDSGLVHVLEIFRGRPILDLCGDKVPGSEFRGVAWGRKVVVNINSMWRGCCRLGCREGPGNQNIRTHGSEAAEEFPATPIGCGAEWTVHLFSRASLFGYLSCASNELHGRPPYVWLPRSPSGATLHSSSLLRQGRASLGRKTRGGTPPPIFLQVFILGSLTHGSP